MVNRVIIRVLHLALLFSLGASLEILAMNEVSAKRSRASLMHPCVLMVQQIERARARGRADQPFDEFLSQLQGAISDGHGTSTHFAIYVDVTGKLWPIFQKGGILRHAVQAELVKRGVVVGSQNHALRWFRDFSPGVQVEFARAVFRRMDALIPRGANFEAVPKINALADKFHMTFDEAKLLVKLWDEYRHRSQGEHILAAILVVLKNEDLQLDRWPTKILSRGAYWWARLTGLIPSLFRRSRDPIDPFLFGGGPKPWVRPKGPRDLVVGGNISSFPLEHLPELLQDPEMDISLKIELIEELLPVLNFQQVRMVADSDELFARLNKDLRERIEGILRKGPELQSLVITESRLQALGNLKRPSEMPGATYGRIEAELTSEHLAHLFSRQIVTRHTQYEYLIQRYRELVGPYVLSGGMSRRQFWSLTYRLAATMAENAAGLGGSEIESFYDAVGRYAKEFAYTSRGMAQIAMEMDRIFRNLKAQPGALTFLKVQHGKSFHFAENTRLIPDAYVDGGGDVNWPKVDSELRELSGKIDQDIGQVQGEFFWPLPWVGDTPASTTEMGDTASALVAGAGVAK